jgi:four helix bundle suffix protein
MPEFYKSLITYQQSEEIFDLTMEFCRICLSEPKFARLREQMESAARSGKQNIVEGAEQKIDSGGYTYLLGVARGSLAELLEDYRDFARNHNLEIWMRGDKRIEDFKKRVEKVKKAERARRAKILSLSRPSNPSSPSPSSQPSNPSSFYTPSSLQPSEPSPPSPSSPPSQPSQPFQPSNPSSPSESSSPSSPSLPSKPSYPSESSITLFVNYLIDLIIRTNYLLDRQRKSLEEDFVKIGSYSEQLRKRRDNEKKRQIIGSFWRKFQ